VGRSWSCGRQPHSDRPLSRCATGLKWHPPRLGTQTVERQKSNVHAESDGLFKPIAHSERAILRRKVAGEIKATIFGFDVQKTVRRAVKRILANLKPEEFNSLEITRVAPKRFLGVPCASVYARSRHVQESVFLFRAKDLPVRNRARSAAA
jgi:hypothetical protein